MPTSYYKLISGTEQSVKDEVNQLIGVGKHKPVLMTATSDGGGVRLFVVIETVNPH